MEYVPVVTLGALGLSLTIGLLITMAWARSEVTARGEAMDKQRAAEAERSKVEVQRDEALASLARSQAELASSRSASVVFEKAAQDAREELIKHVREKLATGTDADVLAEVNRLLLGQPLPAVRPAGETPSADHGDPGPAAVHPPA